MPSQLPRPRQWGTRFDSLPSSPPPSPKSEGALVQDYPDSDARTVEPDASFVNRKHEKMPHDASVFVGSLPPHIDNNELVRLLSEHLAEHAEVKCVKVIRDNKGGACAFVQCQDAASAARLIHTLHSNPPKPFMGRHLRYEQARAFRTLLISYCTPQHHVTVPEYSAEARNISGNAIIELDLPRAMRISRSRQSRTQTIHYNEVAVELERKARQSQEPSVEHDLHIEPLMFDEKTLRTICTHFGALETFQHYWPSGTFPEGLSDEEIVKWTLFPAPHNFPRKSVMDNHVFEVKWEHRDDCVNALMTLRKVPHFKISWAHASAPSHFDRTGRPVHSMLQSTKYTDCPLTQQSRHGNSCESLEPPDWKSDIQEADQVNVSTWAGSDFPLRDAEEDSVVMFSSETLENVQNFDPVTAGTEMCNELEVTSAAVVSCPSPLSEEVELDLPAATALTTSTPKSPASAFLLTPTSTDGRSIREVDNDDYNFRLHNPRTSMEKVVDTSTLFVGGLDMHGPGAWDEAKLQNYFQRFGGLQNVKIVRPASGKAAFAFVKFNNTESAARAIQQEHNRVYQGRAMRVQFRECNPSRATFMKGRGRGRFLQVANHPPRQELQPQHTFADRSGDSLSDMSMSTADRTRTQESKPFTAESSIVLPRVAGADGLEQVTDRKFPEKQDSIDFPNLCQSSSPHPIETTQPERYREWYEVDVHSQDTHSTGITPPPSTPLSGSESVPGGTVYPTAGYYPPPPWVQPYPPQVQYPMPYLPGYPIYPIPNPTQPPYTNLSGSDGTNGTTSTAPNHWPIYSHYVPYPAPYHLRPPHTAEQSTPPPPPPPHAQSQPPVVPSGFIQGEQGTLIAVYRQDALDNYMHQSANGNIAPPQSQPPRIWSQYPQPSPYPPTAPSQAPLRIAPVPGYIQVPKQTGGNAPSWVPHPGGARLGPPLVGFPINANVNASREYDGHGNMGKRGRRDGGFHPRHGYIRQGTHRQGRRETHVPVSNGGYGEENCSEFATNAADGNVGNYNTRWVRREPIKGYHLS
ncbi:hypothetical protein E1B28_000883 [Marasmius oreades]|uniref:RRM domain-containing protein n=1 Tax=Marasmius oreades TaxID=181124 RepID=A0A9P8AEU1_9AGAR|nr:uncharacterized protein E1B28_000883 [Marasmius oreades]KAG7098997.1 hypothetical protein E1B28_000883 [Marasmius oreades]